MKKNTTVFFILFLTTFILNKNQAYGKALATGGDDDAMYKKSSYNDLSFEGRLTAHKKEINYLNNFYTNYSNEKKVVNIYQTLLANILKDAYAQYKFMQEKNIDLDDLRQTSLELSTLNTGERARYQFSLKMVESEFAISEKEVKEMDALIERVKKDASNSLSESMKLYQSYIHKAQAINYTKLEMIEDATGFKNPEELLNNETTALNFTRKNQGLTANEAIRKLSTFDNSLVVETSSIYPNPFSSNLKLEIYNPNKGQLQVNIYDMFGRRVKSITNTSFVPYVELSWDGTDDGGNKLAKGVYIVSIETDGAKESKKIIMK